MAQHDCDFAGYSTDQDADCQAHCNTPDVYAPLCMCILEGEQMPVALHNHFGRLHNL
jgi:hypothetical protein